MNAPKGVSTFVALYDCGDPLARQRIRNEICLAFAACDPLATPIDSINIKLNHIHKADRSISARERVPASAMVISSSVRKMCST